MDKKNPKPGSYPAMVPGLPLHPEVEKLRRSIVSQESEITRKNEELANIRRALQIEEQVMITQKAKNAESKLETLHQIKSSASTELQTLDEQVRRQSLVHDQAQDLEVTVSRQQTIKQSLEQEEATAREKEAREAVYQVELQKMQERLEAQRKELETTNANLEQIRLTRSTAEQAALQAKSKQASLEHMTEELVESLDVEQKRLQRLLLGKLLRGVMTLSLHRIKEVLLRYFSMWKLARIEQKIEAEVVASEVREIIEHALVVEESKRASVVESLQSVALSQAPETIEPIQSSPPVTSLPVITPNESPQTYESIAETIDSAPVIQSFESVEESSALKPLQEVEVAAAPPEETPVAAEPSSADPPVLIDMTQYEYLSPVYQSEVRDLLSNNPLIKAYFRCSPSSIQEPVDIQTHANALIDYSIQRYNDRHAKGQRTSPISVFALGYFIDSLGEVEGNLTAGRFVGSVLQKAQNGDSTGKVLARMLSFPGFLPISFSCSLYFPRICLGIKTLVAKSKKDTLAFSLDAQIPASDLLFHFYDLFAHDPIHGERLFLSLNHPELSTEELGLFIVNHRLRMKNMDSMKIFKILDENKDGQIVLEEFVQGLKLELGLWMSDETLRKIFKIVDLDGSGSIKRAEFNQLFNFKAYNENARSPKFTFSIVSILAFFLDLQDWKTQRDLSLFESALSQGEATFPDFQDIVHSLFPEMTADKVQRLYEEARRLENSEEMVSREAVVRSLLRYPTLESPLCKSLDS